MHDSEWVTPTTLCVDPTTHCQLRCPGCPNTGRGNPPPGKLGTPPGMGWGSMKIEDFKTLVDAPPGFEKVYFSSLGEMFLNRDFLAMIEYAHAKGLEISMDSVNFNHVSDAVLDGLVRCGVKHIVCAIDGATPESYRIYRKRGNSGAIRTATAGSSTTRMQGNPPGTFRIRGELDIVSFIRPKNPPNLS